MPNVEVGSAAAAHAVEDELTEYALEIGLRAKVLEQKHLQVDRDRIADEDGVESFGDDGARAIDHASHVEIDDRSSGSPMTSDDTKVSSERHRQLAE